jgi:tRNA G18 (ribose-2'-O)-methylase SpoU
MAIGSAGARPPGRVQEAPVVIRIKDASDPRMAPYGDVADPAALLRAGLFVAEGRLVVRRLLEDGRFQAESVLVTEGARQALHDLLEGSPGIPVLVADRDVLNAVTGFNFHRGCLALARRPSELPPLDSFAGATRLLALERVSNPDNVGGLFRVASALDAGGILLDQESADPLYRKAVRTSMGAALRVPFTRATDWPSAIAALRAVGFRVIALTPAQDASSIGEVPRASKLLFLLGAEGEGLREETERLADLRVRIPVNPAADSLNVVVAAAIALHALR